MSELWGKIKRRTPYYIPILKWLPKYSREDLPADIKSSVALSLLLIPQSLSYSASLAHLPPIYGLYTCFTSLFIYGILGTSRQLSVGPEALVSLLVGNVIKKLVGVGAEANERVQVATFLSLVVGVITFLLGFARMGFIDSVLSRALLRGFVTAVAVVILIEQLPALLGIIAAGSDHGGESEEEHFESPFVKFVTVLQDVFKGNWNWLPLLISTLSISFLASFSYLKKRVAASYSVNEVYEEDMANAHLNDETRQSDDNIAESEDSHLFPSLRRQLSRSRQDRRIPFYVQFLLSIPEILIVVFVTIIFTYAFKLNSEPYNLNILGDAALSGGFRTPQTPKITAVRFERLLTPAILISVLGFVESIVSAKKYALLYCYSVSANRELIALGSMNLLGTLLNSFPAFSSIARTTVNGYAKTQLSGVITGFIVLFTILFALPIFYYLPYCVMASIVVMAASALLEFEDIHFLFQIRAWGDIFLMSLTFLVTIFWSVESGVLVAVGLSLLMVVKHSTGVKISILGKVLETTNAEENPVTGTSGESPIVKQQQKIKFKPINEIYRNHGEISKDDMEILIVRIDEALFFANTGQLMDRLRRAEAYGGWMHVHPSEEGVRGTAGLVAARLNFGEAERSVSNQQFSIEEGLARFETVDSTPLASPTSHAMHVLPSEIPHLRGVIFDIENMAVIDATAIQTLLEIVQEYKARDIEVCFVKLRDSCKQVFLRSGILGEVLGSDRFFRKIADAEKYLREKWEFEDNRGSKMSTDYRKFPPPTSFSAYNII